VRSAGCLENTALDLQELGTRSGDAFDEHPHAGRPLGHLADDAHRPDLVQIVGTRLVRVGRLQQGQDHPVAREGAVHRLNRHRTAHPERRNAQRQDDGTAKRNDRELGRKCGRGRLCHA
jgi:hypothetical protein